LIRTLHEGLLVEGISVPLAKLCAWFGVPRRTIYYKPTKAAPKVDPRLADPIMDLPGKSGEHQLRNQEVFYGKREQAYAGISA
jgi:hypothetical protein